MRYIFIIVVMAFAYGCRASMVATSTCNFTPSKTEGTYYRWVVPGDAKCSFTLNSPINRARDVGEFADAFARILGNVPVEKVDTKQEASK